MRKKLICLLLCLVAVILPLAMTGCGNSTTTDTDEESSSRPAVSINLWLVSDKEVSALNRLSTAFLDFAELRAERQIITTMADWKKQLDEFLALYKYDTLNNAGTISAEQAKEKAYTEYDKFRLIQDKEYLSDFDKEIKVWKEKGLFGED